ncbi:MAG: hypothetical protein HN472_00565 [Nitrospina sp.]|nr:hypothetical protein [Nitrospina sp.]MBT3508018.1 hypothetical protein [Nitrospina sp.]MBT3876545.1 hypothetical protein [Nitrospina sp.]MBT4049564.1 hypothetical protein [Nitrospina sp.]MBT4558276.1 hypothetical protein [Nitrospina sp.]
MSSPFIKSADQLPLLTNVGRKFLGLEHNKSPELAHRVQSVFHFLNGKLGFPDTETGRHNQGMFNLLICTVYPEILIDLADLIYVQHERPAVYLNFDHIHLNLRKDGTALSQPMEQVDEQLSYLFCELGNLIKNDPFLYNDPEWTTLLGESYSFYLSETKNFPWDNPMELVPHDLSAPLMDVATGLAGFRLIHDWPKDFPRLVLADNMPFIIKGLIHFAKQSGKKNIEVLNVDFPDGPLGKHFGCILVSKFLHHLQRAERQQFLRWAKEALEPEGSLLILDTDLECQILKRARNPEYQKKLTHGYLETLVEIEDSFCETLIQDVRQIGFDVSHFDFHEYEDETDAYSQLAGDNLSIKFVGLEIIARRLADGNGK